MPRIEITPEAIEAAEDAFYEDAARPAAILAAALPHLQIVEGDDKPFPWPQTTKPAADKVESLGALRRARDLSTRVGPGLDIPRGRRAV